MPDYRTTDELYHWGVKGMKWGVRKKRDDGGQPSVGARIRSGFSMAKSAAQKGVNNAQKAIKKGLKKSSNSEIVKRGKSALDVLMNGDTDWMGNHDYADDAGKEIRNRGKAALERLMYSQEQIDNKKFFGRYDF